MQLHGSESEYDIDQLRFKLNELDCQTQIWKAVAVSVDSDDCQAPSTPANADRLLYDSKTKATDGVQFGGTGHAFNWQQQLPNKADAMLAGGLNAGNAFDAARQGFFGLDFNSGLESAPGVKDAELIKQAFTALREY